MTSIFFVVTNLKETNPVDGRYQAVTLCNNLAVLLTQCKAGDLMHRVMLLLQLHQHWIRGHCVKFTCLTCDDDEVLECTDSDLKVESERTFETISQNVNETGLIRQNQTAAEVEPAASSGK